MKKKKTTTMSKKTKASTPKPITVIPPAPAQDNFLPDEMTVTAWAAMHKFMKDPWTFDELDAAKTKANEIAHDEGIKAPENRKSIYGSTYPGSYESDWKFYGGPKAGWVHFSEEASFRENYAECYITKHWYSRYEMAGAIIMDGDESKEVIVHKSQTKNLKVCGYSGKWFDPKHGIEAYGAGGQHITVAPLYAKSLFKCDISGKLYLNSNIFKVVGSEKYKLVSGYEAQSTGLVKQCNMCGKWFESATMVFADLGEGNLLYCPKCEATHKYKGSIKPYNYKSYLEPKFVLIKRRGAVKNEGEGLFYAAEIETSAPMRLFGVEAEVELHKPAVVALGGSRMKLAHDVVKCLGKDFCYTVEDGSLTTNGKYDGKVEFDPEGTKNGPMYAGFEIVSCPADIPTHAERWYRLDGCKELHDAKGNRLLRAWDTDTCGFHVHVTRAALTNLMIGQILRFVNHKNNARFIQKVAGRPSDKFCRYLDKEVADALHPERVISPEETEEYHRKRRTAVNVCNAKTIEWRIFRGTIHPKHMIRNIQFVDAQCEFFMPGSRSIKEADDYRYFIDYIDKNRKRWPLVAEWMGFHKMIEVKAIKDGVIPIKPLTLQLHDVAEHEIKVKDEPPPPEVDTTTHTIPAPKKKKKVSIEEHVEVDQSF